MLDPNLFNDIEKFLETGDEPWPSAAPISAEELETIVRSANAATGGPITEDEAIGLLRWAENIRVGQSLLDLVLAGLVDVLPGVDDIYNPSFKISEYGKRVVDAGTQIS